ncbi:MAG: NADH-quinone oxidoreductase subunit L [Planctomycetes bacterium]|nr:NADH-quinone oxidoreductase subunit L [Planctomycetota bacterium]
MIQILQSILAAEAGRSDWFYSESFLKFGPLAVLFIPLALFVFIFFLKKKLGKSSDAVAIGGMFIAFLIASLLFVRVVVQDFSGIPEGVASHGSMLTRDMGPSLYHATYLEWMSFDTDSDGTSDIAFPMGVMLDGVSAIMAVVVTLLGLVVCIYSTWYMHGDDYYAEYFAKMCFFLFAMLGIVYSDNLLFTFVSWELVGLGSYFLIGFWFQKPAQPHPGLQGKVCLNPAFAQTKAFITNRVGDFGFMVGLSILLFLMTSSTAPAEYGSSPLSYLTLYSAVENVHPEVAAAHGAGYGWLSSLEISILGFHISGFTLLTLAGIGVFMGAIGKSAQFPLHTWLPDAMQGPTTGSSIIHAATMVAAGVYLVARMHPIMTDGALLFIALIGGITCLLAATMATVQDDFKAILAYSTVSQLGYMMLGLGAGGYFAGLSHLFTHAFFKCMLFLCAGAVIHTVHTQDIWKLGGLRRKMPLVWIASLAGCLAIAGVPLFSAFYSKDEILAVAFAYFKLNGGITILPWLFGTITAVLTPYYMFRWLILAFHGKPRDKHLFEHIHHGPSKAAVYSLLFLALFTPAFIWEGVPNLPVGSWWNNFANSSDWMHETLPAYDAGLAHTGRSLGADGAEDHAERVAIASVALVSVSKAADSKPEASAGGEHESATYFGAADANLEHEVHEVHLFVGLLSLLLAFAGIGLAYHTWKTGRIDAESLAKKPAIAKTRAFLLNLWYIDIFYHKFVIAGELAANKAMGWFDDTIIDKFVDFWAGLTRFFSAIVGVFDNWVVDNLVDLWGYLSSKLGSAFREIQDGQIQTYLTFGVFILSAIAGAIILLTEYM